MWSKEQVYFLGDLHGREAITLNTIPEGSLVILLGDTGLNFFPTASKNIPFKEYLNGFNLTFLAIRGNHDQRVVHAAKAHNMDWSMTFNRDVGNYVYVETKYPNILYALDGVAMYEIAGARILSIPGAYSVDKYYRIANHWTWYDDEQLSNDEMRLGEALCEKNNWETDIIISHTCPSCFIPTDLFLPGLDQSTVDNTMERYLGGIEFKLNYKAWLWGHYHRYREYPIGEDGRKRIMLFNDKAVSMEEVLQ